MDPSEQDVFVDHKETVISVPRPRQLSASKVDIKPAEDTAVSQSTENGAFTTAQDDIQFSLPTTVLDTASLGAESLSDADSTTSFIVRESSTTSTDSSASATTTTTRVEKHVTSLYTQRISGRSSRSSDSGSDISSPTPSDPQSDNTPVFGGSREAQSPTEVCSVQFSVAAGVTSSTTTAFSKVFTKTVETEVEEEQETEGKERHLSECSITVGGGETSPKELESRSEQVFEDPSSTVTQGFDAQETLSKFLAGDGGAVSTELTTTSTKAEEEKEVAEYSPGLAIRTLTLEDLREKKSSPERESPPAQNNLFSTDMFSKSLLAGSSSSSTAQQQGFFSSYASQIGDSMSPPGDTQQTFSSSEFSSSEKLTSESMTSVTSSSTSLSSLTSSGQVLMQCTEDSSAAALHKPFFNPIEVERKFTISEDTEERLRSLGARLHKEKVFTDVYYDNDDYDLIIRDCWLRRRNDTWEAKIPLESQNNNALFAPASQYREISSEKDISAWLVDRLGLEAWMRGDPIDLLVQAAGLSEFARFTTTRRSYTLPSCVVDLDLTDHGFRVGEIEVMAASPEEVAQALQTIGGVAKQLGLSPLTLL